MNEYRVNGYLHRHNGPAVIWVTSGWGDWWLFGVFHRYYGPQNPANFWWIHGAKIK